ncbi:MAG: hypothetical protein KF709_12995 [Gemmatimonadaceae bacterium]|nr:hypothetical protein [Gemmatimonadaceae bacterium]
MSTRRSSVSVSVVAPHAYSRRVAWRTWAFKRLAVSLAVACVACDGDPTLPSIVDVTEPGTFSLQVLNPVEPTFTGIALVNYCAAATQDRGLRLRTPSWPGEDITMYPQGGIPAVLMPVPTGEHRFSELAGGNQTYTVRHDRRALSGLAVENGIPTPDGSIEILESSMSTLRGRIDLRFKYYYDSASPPKLRRLRGSFWAVADPACAEAP